jgi:hypothetical protein
MIPCERDGSSWEIPPPEEEFTDRHFSTDWELCTAFKDHRVPGEYSFDENDFDVATILPIVTKRLVDLTLENGKFRVCHLGYLFQVLLHTIHDGPLPESAEYLLDRYLQGWNYEFSLPSSSRTEHDIYLCETTYLILLGMGFENECLVGAFEQLLLRGEEQAKHYCNLMGDGENRFGSILLPLVKKRFSILLNEKDRNGEEEENEASIMSFTGWTMIRGMRGVVDNPLNAMLF